MLEAKLWTDGSCFPNPGPGGWAFVVQTDGQTLERSGTGPAFTTNNQMELTAAIEGLRFFKEPTSVAVYTDSQYLRTGAVEWLPAWVRGQYRRKIRGVGWGQIPNAELWKEIDRLIHFHSVTWAWVRGHGDDSINCRCDKLAEKARKAR